MSENPANQAHALFLVLLISTVTFLGPLSQGTPGTELCEEASLELLCSTFAYKEGLSATDGSEFDWFGYSVALDGDTALISNSPDNPGNELGIREEGAVYVYQRHEKTWIEQAKLTASDGAIGDVFGFSVALDGDTALVGAFDHWAGDQGAVYVYEREGNAWTEQAKLSSSDGTAIGASVAIDGDTALIGASGSDAAYIYERHGPDWTEQAKITSFDPTWNSFGWSVAVDNNTALIGAPYTHTYSNMFQGAAYLYKRDGDIWTHEARLIASDGTAWDEFGYSVALNGNTALIGAYRANIANLNFTGAAYVFEQEGTAWNEQTRLNPPDFPVAWSFGRSVDLDNDTALIGAGDAAYVFNLSNPAHQTKLTTIEDSEGLGRSVALDGDTAFIGAYLASANGNQEQGATHVYGELAEWL